MALSWLSRSRGVADVDSLVARGRYAKAAKVLRAEFEGRQPTIAERLRFADLLVLADRGGEALPVLLGVADEQLRYGFRDKALEALRRAKKIDPADPQVRRRLRALHEAPAPDSLPDSPPNGDGEGDWGAALDGAFPSPATDAEPETAPEVEGNGSAAGSAPVPPLSEDALEDGGWAAEPFLPETDLEPEEEGEEESLLLEADLEASEAEPALGDEGPEPRALEPLLTEADLSPEDGETLLPHRRPELDEVKLHAFVLALARRQGAGRLSLSAALFAEIPLDELREVAGGLSRRRFAPGDVLVSEGEPGDSVFLIARGSVRILVLGGHGQPFDVRRLDAGDFFGEVAVMSGRPRSATVVAATPCETLEVARPALEALLSRRPEAQRLLDEACVSRALSQEEKAVRSLPPEAADPERAADALRAHFGGSEWSLRVRLHLAQLMLDVGRQEDALAILAGVAEDLARHGHAQKAIAVLKRVEWIRRRGIHEISLAPLKRGRRPRGRPQPSRGSLSAASTASRAVTEAAFREWVGSMLRETHALASRPAPAPQVEEPAEGEGEDERHPLPQDSA